LIGSIVPKESQSAKREKLTASTLFGFAGQHFALVSAIALLAGFLGATAFLFGYLSVFDWRLIWLIEYADILKVGLVATAVISGIAVFIGFIIDRVMSRADRGADNVTYGLFLFGVLTVATLIRLLLEYLSPNPRYGLFLSLYFATALALLLLFLFVLRGFSNVAEGTQLRMSLRSCCWVPRSGPPLVTSLGTREVSAAMFTRKTNPSATWGLS
jgi:hypothetical protein